MGRLTRSGWFSASYSSAKRKSRRNHSTRPESRRLHLEPLEDRRLLAAVTVGNGFDTVNGDTTSIAALIADPGADGISLREAILAANATPGADSITFADGLARVTINTLNLAITDHLDIQGPLNGPVILSGPSPLFHQFTGAGRILDIAAGANVSISRLAFMNGDVDNREGFNPPGEAFGGAIRNAGTLTVRNSLFYNNGAGEPNGGIGGGGGGAIYNSGSLTVIASSFAANFADWGSGGAIYNAGTASVTNSTFIDNYTGLSGGAIFNAVGSTMTVNHCTILKCGGDPQGPVLGYPVGSGGISNLGTMTLNNTIVADTPVGSDVENSGVITGSHNLIKDGSGSLPGTIITGDPMLAAPVYTAANSLFPALTLLPRPGQYGPPFTFSPLPGSPAIDAGNNDAVSSFVDQRGAPRINNGVVDIGAVEVGIAPVGIVVTTLTDENDDSIDPALGAGTSLREALSLKLPEDVTITFAPGLAGTIALDASLASLQIIDFHITVPSQRGGVTIVGPGADVITLDGLAQTQILRIENSGPVSISDLTFARGTTGEREGGGAIFVRSNLTLTDCFFVDNSSVYIAPGLPFFTDFGGGGAIAAWGTLSAINCTFSENSAAAFGGAIANNGKMTVADSTFIGNSARYGGGIGSGYFDVQHTPGFIRPTVTSSTFSENSATQFGGAIYLASHRGFGHRPAELSVINSTISNNSAGLNGGGIHVAGDLTLLGSTVYGNSAASAGPAVAGGIAIGETVDLNYVGLVTLVNNIVAGSTSGADLTIFLISNGIVTGSHNLIGDGSGSLPNTITGDPLLGPLADNGGPTETHALLPGSPAIDAGDNVTLQFPTGLTLVLFPGSGFLPENTHFAYRVSAFNALGESPAAEASIMSGIQNLNAVRLSWNAVPGAWGYNIYGRTEGAEQFLGRVWSDNSQFSQFWDHGTSIPTDAFDTRVNVDQRKVLRPQGSAPDLGAFEVQTPELAGDYNRDGIVDAADYTVWRNTLGTTGVPAYSGADGNGDGTIDPDDYGVWRANFGNTLPLGGRSSETTIAVELAASTDVTLSEPTVVAVAASADVNAPLDNNAIEQPPNGAMIESVSVPRRWPLSVANPSAFARVTGSRPLPPIATSQFRTMPPRHHDALLAWIVESPDSRQSNHGDKETSKELEIPYQPPITPAAWDSVFDLLGTCSG